MKKMTWITENEDFYRYGLMPNEVGKLPAAVYEPEISPRGWYLKKL